MIENTMVESDLIIQGARQNNLKKYITHHSQGKADGDHRGVRVGKIQPGL